MVNRRSFKLTVVFSFIVFSNLVLSVLATGPIAWLLFKLGIVTTKNRRMLFVVFSILILIIGTLISKFIGKRHINCIVKISDATKEVSKGNFNIQLDEKIYTTELKTMAENFNIMTKELASTELLRNDFIENVSHEFKTPLSAIEGYVTLLQNPKLSTETRIEYTKKILHNTKRLSSLTGNILLLSRLENQKIDIEKEKYYLDEQLCEVILDFEQQWTKKNLKLEIDLKEDTEYYGNKQLLYHVWQNIIGNAIKFVENKGYIKILLYVENDNIKVSITL